MVRGDGWIEKRGSSLRVRWRDGEVTRSRRVADEDEAERVLLEVKQLKRSSRYVAPIHMTVRELVEGYIERGVHRWSANTVWTYRDRAVRDVYPALGAVLVQQLTTSRVQQWVDSLVRKGRSANSVEGVVRVLGGAYREAVRLKITTEHVVQGVTLPKVQRKELVTWTRSEVESVLRVVADDPLWHAYYRLALGTGMRPGELRALMWQDIDIEAGTIRVRRSMTRNAEGKREVGGETKTGAARTILMPSSVVAALKVHKRHQVERQLAHEAWIGSGIVLDRGDGAHLGQSTVEKHHRIVITKAGVRPLHAHGLRHAYATLALANGVPLKVVSETLGHKSVAITADVYVHVSLDMQRDAALIVDRFLG